MAQSRTQRLHISRRRLLIGSAAFGGTALAGRLPTGLAAPALITSDRERPQIPCGVMSGDPTGGRAIIWSKTDRPARMLVEFATREDFRDAQRVPGPALWRFPITPRGSISVSFLRARRSFIA